MFTPVVLAANVLVMPSMAVSGRKYNNTNNNNNTSVRFIIPYRFQVYTYTGKRVRNDELHSHVDCNKYVKYIIIHIIHFLFILVLDVCILRGVKLPSPKKTKIIEVLEK